LKSRIEKGPVYNSIYSYDVYKNEANADSCFFFQAGKLRNVWCEYSVHFEQEMKRPGSLNSSKLSNEKERPVSNKTFHVSCT